ncbi:hypothetical protein EON63_17495 [archaeon]|nr:MAG: hypothetical protein EON63_17495 [archaeon]
MHFGRLLEISQLIIMTSRKSVSISPTAYVKIGLHVSKYYYAPVVGYLIGKTGDKVSPPNPPTHHHYRISSVMFPNLICNIFI